MARLNDFMAKVDLSPFYDFCNDKGKIVSYRKGDCLVEEGSVCRFIGIVKSGYFKYSALRSDGEECVTGFSFTNELVGDYVRSFLYNRPSMISIVAGCDASLLQVQIQEVRPYMLERYPEIIANVSSLLLQEAYSRYLSIHTLTPLERYKELLPRFQDVIDTIPYREMASYLSISQRHFLRIRDALIAQKTESAFHTKS